MCIKVRYEYLKHAKPMSNSSQILLFYEISTSQSAVYICLLFVSASIGQAFLLLANSNTP